MAFINLNKTTVYICKPNLLTLAITFHSFECLRPSLQKGLECMEEYESIRIPSDECLLYLWCERDYEKHCGGFEQ